MPPVSSSFRFSFEDPWLLVGSCFTEHIGDNLKQRKFNTLQNPHGILFNPMSIVKALYDYMQNVVYTEDDLFLYNDTWYSWFHHSRYAHQDAKAGVCLMNQSIQQAHQYLKNCKVLCITLGSAWAYYLSNKVMLGKRSSFVVSNCHQLPDHYFERKLLVFEELKQVFVQLLHSLLIYNPTIKIIFSISPVRHAREGLVENNRSKAVLIQLVHDICDMFKEQAYYFPAYELIIDDLRDYRFYAEDLIHPNYLATQYVWEYLLSCFCSYHTLQAIKEIDDIHRAYMHQPMHQHSKAHRKFLQSYLEKTKQMQCKYPYIDFSKELDYFAHF